LAACTLSTPQEGALSKASKLITGKARKLSTFGGLHAVAVPAGRLEAREDDAFQQLARLIQPTLP
jgi:hypothetical protein